MTADQPHPAWCDPDQCRAYVPGMEPLHRSAPILLAADLHELLAVYLSQPVGHEPRVELVVVESPVAGPVWAVEHTYAEMVLPLDPAAALADALRQLVRAAVTS